MESIFGAGYLSGRQTALAPLAAPRLARRRRDPSGGRLLGICAQTFPRVALSEEPLRRGRAETIS